MKISDKLSPAVKNILPSGIRKFFDLVNEMKDIIPLSIGEPDFETPWNITQAGIHSLENGHTHYSPNAGFMELRKAISKYLENNFQTKYSPQDSIIVTVGGSEAIDIAFRAILCAGDEVLIPEPSFVAYKPCVLFNGAIPVTIELEEKDNFKLTADKIEKAITNKTKAIIISYPNNPTGAIMTREELKEIVDVLKDKEIFIISDEIYAELTYEGTHASIASFDEIKDKTILIGGFSKSFAMTGWRLGYACGHPEVISSMIKIHQYVIMSAPTVAQYAAIEGLENSKRDVEKMRTAYNHRRRVMVDGFRKAGLECFEPKGAFYVFPNITSTGLSSEEFCQRLLLEEKVAIVPGSAFGSCGEGFVRACYAYSIENIQEAMIRIQRFSSRYKK